MPFLRYMNAAMVVVFVVSLALQYNDPDPFVWMALYGTAACLSVAYAFGRLRWQWAGALAVLAAAWALTLYPEFAGRVSLPEVMGSFTMKSATIEYAREASGLAIVSVWMTVLAVRSRAERDSESHR